MAGQLYDLSEHLRENCVSLQTREHLRDEVLCYIKDCNSGIDDELYELAFATCCTDADLRTLAQRFEQLDGFSRRRAMEIYRQIGADEHYLRLRQKRMEYGPDYVDLTEFFWERGDQQRALQVAQQGLKQATGALDGLRSFLAQRAREEGNRHKYLQLEFSRLAAKRLTLQNYRNFKKLCSEDEWRRYEPRVLKLLSDAPAVVQIDILLERKQLQSAVELFSECSYPSDGYRLGDSRLLKLAEMLQKEFPEQILKFYCSGLRDIDITAPRKKYAEQAEILAKVRHLMLQVMDDRQRWEKLAGKIKRENHNKPAFQQEFALVIPDWDQLG